MIETECRDQQIGLPYSEKEVIEKRAAVIIDGVGERVFSLGWRGVGLGEKGKIKEVLAAKESPLEFLPRLISRLEEYRDEEGESFFAEKEEVLDSVLGDLILVYVWNFGQNFESPTAFSGERPKEWGSNYWQLVRAVSSHYPSESVPLIQLLGFSEDKKELFEQCLKNGEKGSVNYNIGQPIEPAKLGLAVKNILGEENRISPRQALSLLVEWKRKKINNPKINIF